MLRPVLALLVLLGSPVSIAHAQVDGEIDPATREVLHDPARRQQRISVVEAELLTIEQERAALPDPAPWEVVRGVGIAAAVVGVFAGVIALVSQAVWEAQHAICFRGSCERPDWMPAMAITAAPIILVGIVTLAIGSAGLGSISGQETQIRRRRDRRRHELDLLRSLDVQVSGDSVVLGASGTF